VYRHAARGLFERHKLLLSLHMAARVLALSGQVNADEWGFLLRGGQVCGRAGLQGFGGGHSVGVVGRCTLRLGGWRLRLHALLL
jgi:hypothetical protein